MTETTASDWLTVPDLVELLDERLSRVRRLLADRILVAKRIDGVLRVPTLFLRDDQPLPELRGTAIVLADVGFTDDEIVDWMLEPQESLGTSPIAALRTGRKAEVRRVAQALG